MDPAFWGTAHVSQAISRASNSNNLIDVDVFPSFPTLSLSAGSTTNFKIQTDGIVAMQTACNPDGTSRGDVGFENDAMQITVGPMGKGSQLWSSVLGTPLGAFRYTVASATMDSPSASPSTSNRPSITASPSYHTSAKPSGDPSVIPSSDPTTIGSTSYLPSISPTPVPVPCVDGSPAYKFAAMTECKGGVQLDEDQCEALASFMGFNYKGSMRFIEKNPNAFPGGCFVKFGKNKVFYNSGKEAGLGCSRKKRCVCGADEASE